MAHRIDSNAPQSMPLTSLKGIRIGIVEDNITNMSVYAVTLKRHGANVLQDHWQYKTIDMFASFKPDIILLDLMLRYGKSGYDIFDEIQCSPALRDVPVVAVSAADPEVEITRAQQKGFRGFLAKPIDVHAFPRHILACINGEHIWDDR